nr:MAG TPA: hypothetical protein [Caudoviricetes sp.]
MAVRVTLILVDITTVAERFLKVQNLMKLMNIPGSMEAYSAKTVENKVIMTITVVISL